MRRVQAGRAQPGLPPRAQAPCHSHSSWSSLRACLLSSSVPYCTTRSVSRTRSRRTCSTTTPGGAAAMKRPGSNGGGGGGRRLPCGPCVASHVPRVTDEPPHPYLLQVLPQGREARLLSAGKLLPQPGQLCASFCLCHDVTFTLLCCFLSLKRLSAVSARRLIERVGRHELSVLL